MPKTKSSQEIREAAEKTYRWHKKIEKQFIQRIRWTSF